MTCFSIQKFFAAALILLIFAVSGLSTARAQESLSNQIEDAESKMRAEKNQELIEKSAGLTDAPILIELFTTKDCSACVFADRMLYDAMADKKVIALSCLVKDMKKEIATASPVSSMDPCLFRQWAYKTARTSNDVTLSLPSFMVNGYDQIGVSNLSDFKKLINSYGYKFKNKTLEIYMQWKDKDTITIIFPQDPNVEKYNINASAWLARYKNVHVEKMSEGLNKDRVLRFSNIIQSIRHIAKWHGSLRSIDVDVPVPQGGKEKGGYVVMVSAMMGEPVMAVGRLDDYPLPNDPKEKPQAPQTEKEKAP